MGLFKFKSVNLGNLYIYLLTSIADLYIIRWSRKCGESGGRGGVGLDPIKMLNTALVMVIGPRQDQHFHPSILVVPIY